MSNVGVVLRSKDMSATDWADEFWDWTCVVYADGDVQKLCLAMQDRFNCNVNFLLLGIWFGQRKHFMSKAAWSVLIKRTARLRTGVRKLREQRRKIKLADREKYEELLNLELKGENLVQAQAMDILLSFDNSILEKNTVESNLIAYIRATGADDAAEKEAKALGALVQNLSD